MADEQTKPEPTKATKQTPQAKAEHPWEKFKVADESEGGLTIYNFRDVE